MQKFVASLVDLHFAGWSVVLLVYCFFVLLGLSAVFLYYFVCFVGVLCFLGFCLGLVGSDVLSIVHLIASASLVGTYVYSGV